jgi:hypothetical protein
MKININQQATAKLTHDGVKVLRHECVSPSLAGFDAQSNTIRLELWRLMQIFGESLYCGGPVMFEGCVIEVEPFGSAAPAATERGAL